MTRYCVVCNHEIPKKYTNTGLIHKSYRWTKYCSSECGAKATGKMRVRDNLTPEKKAELDQLRRDMGW